MPKIYRMIDKTDKFIKKKAPLFDLPFRLLLVGKSGMGKTSLIGNLLLRNDMYRRDFHPENIFIFSGSLDGDQKLKTLISELEIPNSNLFDSYDETALEVIYDTIVDRFNEDLDEKKKPSQSLIILDDLSFTGRLASVAKKDDQLNRLFSNGRKYLISTLVTSQKYTQLSTCCRENATGLILGQMSNKQLDLVEADVNFLKNKKEFQKMFRDETPSKHDFMIVNFSIPSLYQTKEFKAIEHDGVKVSKTILDKKKH
jgi:hypothetical protein